MKKSMTTQAGILLIMTLISFLIAHPINSYGQDNDKKLKQQIGQMIIIGFNGKSIDETDTIANILKKQTVGGVILFDYNFQTKTYDKNIESPAQVKKLIEQLNMYYQKNVHAAKQSHLPLLISVDYEGGMVDRLKPTYGFPKTPSAAQIVQEGVDEAKTTATVMVNTLSNAKFNLNLAPVLDVNINPNNPVIGKLQRSFSSDPEIVAQFAAVFAETYRKHSIACAYKHFPGHGSATIDSHLGFVDVTDTWQNSELVPFRRLLNKPYACQIVMTAHIVNRHLDSSGRPATLSKPILTDLLRHQLGFKGVIMSDDLQMKAITDNYGTEQAVVEAINAGVDILIFGNQLVPIPQNPDQLVDIIYRNVINGKIERKRIQESYQRIIALKRSLVKK